MSSIVDLADSASGAITTPLPSASPSALMTIGNRNSSQNRIASSLRSNVPARAVGIPSLRISSFAKIFDDSIRAAALLGPKIRNPSARKRSTMPAARGSSGPTTVRSTRFPFAKRTSAGKSLTEIATFSASCAVPALPGAQKIRSTPDDCFNFQASACSRPPPPMTRIFTIRDRNRPGCVGEFASQRFALHCARLRRQNRQFQFFGVANGHQFRGNANLLADQHLVEVVNRADRSLVESNNDVALPQTGALCRAVFFDRGDQHACFQRQTIKSDHAPMQRHILTGDTDITAPNPPVTN